MTSTRAMSKLCASSAARQRPSSSGWLRCAMTTLISGPARAGQGARRHGGSSAEPARSGRLQRRPRPEPTGARVDRPAAAPSIGRGGACRRRRLPSGQGMLVAPGAVARLRRGKCRLVAFTRVPTMQTAYVLVSPCKDEARYIEKTLKSIERQTIKPAQWVIVDDGSTDDGMAIVERYRERMPFIKVVHRDSGARAVGPGRHPRLLRGARERRRRPMTSSASSTSISSFPRAISRSCSGAWTPIPISAPVAANPSTVIRRPARR